MLRAKPESCQSCQCFSHGTDFSAVEGAGSLGVMLVGEASGEHEQREGLPFRPGAPAGGVLTRILRNMGLSREQFAITNVLRCRPRNNWLEKAPWEYQALMHCRPNLEQAILERKPRCIVALGGTAMRELSGMTGAAQGIGHLAGYVLPSRVGRKWPAVAEQKLVELGLADTSAEPPIPVIGNFHPAYLRRGKASHQGIWARIIKRATNIAAGRDHDWLWNVDPSDPSTWGNLQFITQPGWDDGYAFLNYVIDNPNLSVAADLETSESASLDEDARDGFMDTNIRLAQFAIMRNDRPWAIALPWEGKLRDIAIGLLHTANRKFGHNWWTFDGKVVRACSQREGWLYRPQGRIDDTLAMFHHWQPDLPAHLQAACSFIQWPFPWKHYGSSDTTLPFYGCCDVASDLLLGEMLEKTLKRDGIWNDECTV